MIQVSTPVVILPSGWGHNSTCIARSLGRFGVPVYSVDCTSRTFVSFSRYCRGKFAWDESASAAKSVQFLLRAGQKISQRSILIATTDEPATLVADNAGARREWFIFPTVGSSLVHTLCSKKEMYQLAKQLGIATPEAFFPASRGDMLKFLESAMFPIIIKGIDGDRLAKCAGKKGFM